MKKRKKVGSTVLQFHDDIFLVRSHCDTVLTTNQYIQWNLDLISRKRHVVCQQLGRSKSRRRQRQGRILCGTSQSQRGGCQRRPGCCLKSPRSLVSRSDASIDRTYWIRMFRLERSSVQSTHGNQTQLQDVARFGYRLIGSKKESKINNIETVYCLHYHACFARGTL